MKLNFLILLKEMLILIIVVSNIDFHISVSIATNLLNLKMVNYQNSVLSTIIITTMDNVLNVGRNFNLN